MVVLGQVPPDHAEQPKGFTSAQHSETGKQFFYVPCLSWLEPIMSIEIYRAISFHTIL